MSFFEQIIAKIFPKEKKNMILTNEVLKRSQQEFNSYEDWYASDVSGKILEKIFRAYHLKKTDIKDPIPIALLQSDKANGFAVANCSSLLDSDYKMLLEHFKKQILAIGYRQSGSNRKVTAEQDRVTTKEFYYLKPPIQMEPPIDQRYGNISIELILHDDKPYYLKLTASVYSDRLYSEPESFSDLVEKLFEKAD
ncbi:hypothetical protein SAMN05661096_03113 [Marivirga sericea]|uniref:Uncharacterized protein n=1 Tax=Marivirga sericea TaxID=1028 RepID=A0A1X7KRS6_9BACT|nr:hypothetical protein [Marivirga sericea]SMG44263.1 hypothetical protein SAMN05661096_03113 [Marivirga sericea]